MQKGGFSLKKKTVNYSVRQHSCALIMKGSYLHEFMANRKHPRVRHSNTPAAESRAFSFRTIQVTGNFGFLPLSSSTRGSYHTLLSQEKVKSVIPISVSVECLPLLHNHKVKNILSQTTVKWKHV